MKDDNISDRLSRIKNLVAGDSGQTPRSAGPATPAEFPARYRRFAEALGGRLVADPSGCYCLVTTVFPFDFNLGRTCLERTEPSQKVAAASFAADEREGEVPLEELVFFDTETTGLGGAGAVAFLVGFGSLTPAGFEVRQYLLPDFSDEAAMLERVLLEFGPDRTLVSYNGIAFDVNLIRDRMIVNRVARDVPRAGHFDLLHAARRLWRRRLADCTLTNIERQIFGFYRDGDIPGHLIPSVYFDWVQGDELGSMGAVLEHNRYDILTLYFLLHRIDAVFRSDGATLEAVDDLYSLSRVYGRRRRHEKVVDNFSALQESSIGRLPDEVLYFHSLAFKRNGDWERAVDLWRRLVDSPGREAYSACLELAKYYEHRAPDLPQALEYARKARQAGPSNARLREQVKARIARLMRKITPPRRA